MEFVTLWGLVPTAIMLYMFVKNFKRDAKEEDKVDIHQNEEILTLKGEISLLKLNFQNLREKVDVNKQDNNVEFGKINTKLDEIQKILMSMTSPPKS